MEILAACREVGSYRGAAAMCGTTHRAVRRVVEAHDAGQARPLRKDRGRNYDDVRTLVTDRVRASSGDSGGRGHGYVEGENLSGGVVIGGIPLEGERNCGQAERLDGRRARSFHRRGD